MTVTAGFCILMTRLHVAFNRILPARRRYTVAMRCLMLLGAYLLVTMVVSNVHSVSIPAGIKEEDYLPFQPEVLSDFPTVDSVEPRIPHILHQTYKDTNIPKYYAEFVSTFVKHNPKWSYYFWTDEAARHLIQERHPNLLPTWESYKEEINRADALRYVVLYEFGGIYVDLDFENFRPLDRVTYKYACIFPTEPFEQSAFRFQTPFLINNAIMMCRPKHPFLKQILDNLPLFQTMYEKIDSAGPAFVTNQFLMYNKFKGADLHRMKITNESNSPYFYKGTHTEDDFDAVYVPNTQYFMDTLDTHGFKETRYYWICRDFENLNHNAKRACLDLKRRGFDREPTKFTFTRHHWMQSHGALSVLRKYLIGWLFEQRKISIFDIVPHCKVYGKEFS